MPKFNMYQSLHTTVIGPERQAGRAADPHLGHAPPGGVRRRRALEVQGRDGPRPGRGRQRDDADDMAWLRQLLDWQRETEDPGEFLESLRFEINRGRGLRLHPARRRRSRCRTGATPVDFAYAIHTEVGHRTHRRPGQRPAGAAGVARSTTATWSRSSPPRRRTPARAATGSSFVKSAAGPQQDPAVVLQGAPRGGDRGGQGRIAKAMRKQGLPLQRLPPPTACSTLARELHYADVSALYAAVGEGHVSAQSVVAEAGQVGSAARTARRRTSPRPRCRPGRRSRGRPATPASWSRAPPTCGCRLARCCTPVPGDDDPRVRHPRRRRVGAPRRLHQRWRTCPTPARAAGRRASGRPPRLGRSWSPSRSRRSTGPGCSPTSPGSCPTSTSTSCPRP